jgi:hypothetical protein
MLLAIASSPVTDKSPKSRAPFVRFARHRARADYIGPAQDLRDDNPGIVLASLLSVRAAMRIPDRPVHNAHP